MSENKKNKFLYEERPFIYAFLGILGLAYAKKSMVALYSGVTLIICSFLIFRMRSIYKKRQEEIQLKLKAQRAASHEKDFAINIKR